MDNSDDYRGKIKMVSQGMLSRKQLVRFVSSNWFFLIVITIFVSEASWLAITSRFPMAFDETYHFHLIQFFSHRLNPIVSGQPSTTYALGAISHNPSFLYHYLLSFPYRLIAALTSSLKIQVISLRFINIAFAVSSLFIMRRILRHLNLTDSLSNIVILVFALTPIVTVLSAQINYDNLIILLSSLAIYETILILQKVNQKQIDVKRLLSLMVLCLFASLVKFTFLPIFLGIVIVLVWRLNTYRKENRDGLVRPTLRGLNSIGLGARLSLVTLIAIGTGLFINFYGVNLVKYHNPVPQCQEVLNVSDCTHYYAWNRNHEAALYKQTYGVTDKMNVLQYSVLWFKVEYYQLFAEILPTGGLVYIARDFYIFVILLSSIATACTLLTLKKVLNTHKMLLPLLGIALVYLAILWLRNYHDYLQLGQPLAIQGRYLLPVLVYFYALGALGIYYALKSKVAAQYRNLQPAIVVMTVFAFLYFGGYVRYLSVVSPNDYWQTQSQPLTANAPAKPVTIGKIIDKSSESGS